MPKLKAEPEWLRVVLPGSAIGVDRDKRMIHGFLVAEEGPFRSEGRGEFSGNSIHTIQRMMAETPSGLKSRFAHPTLSDDGLGKFLGRARNPRLVEVVRDGQRRSAVRADLHLSDTAFEGNPNGNLGEYLLDLAEEDPDAMGASLVLQVDQERRLDEHGRPLKDSEGNDLPPIWKPKMLHAVDIVDTGDATRAFLSAGELPDELVRRGSELLDIQFAGCDEATIRARCNAWLDRYLAMRFPEATPVKSDEKCGRAEIIQRLLRLRG